MYWENNSRFPQLRNYPKFIEVLGFSPFDFDTSTLGGKIKVYRYQKGLNRKKLSKILGVDKKTLRDWEDNNHAPMPKSMNILEVLLKRTES